MVNCARIGGRCYNDPILNKLEEQAMAANPDLQAAAERFVQARDVMMKARSQYLPQAGVGFGASDNRQSVDALFRSPDISTIRLDVYTLGGLRPGSPIFGRRFAMPRALNSTAPKSAPLTMGSRASACRRKLRRTISRCADTTRRLRSIPNRSTSTHSRSTSSTPSSPARSHPRSTSPASNPCCSARRRNYAQIQGQRQVTEQAIAILLNMAPASFKIEPVDELRVANFAIPRTIPSTLLERRPDIAGMERRMAQANRAIGIARAAFYPDVRFRAGGGYRRCRLQSGLACQ